MSAIREFALQDLFKFNRIVFNQLTEVYSLEFFLNKFLEYPFLSEVATAPDGQIMGFLIGCRVIDSDNRVGDTKHFDFNNNHGHVSVLSIDHLFRCLGLGTILMNLFKAKLDLKKDLFVDLYVRRRNVRAVRLYISLGYVIWRELPRYYRDDVGEMHLDDLFTFNPLVFDPFTEVYRIGFFMRHIAQWPELAAASIAPDGRLVGFIFGKFLDGVKDNTQQHGHVCALTVLSDYRRLGIASLLMNYFAQMLDLKSAWYVDLYLRCSNSAAYNLYCALGYAMRRVLLDYYPGDPEENAYDMRMPLSVDVNQLSLALASRKPVRLPLEDDSDDDY